MVRFGDGKVRIFSLSLPFFYTFFWRGRMRSEVIHGQRESWSLGNRGERRREGRGEERGGEKAGNGS